MRRQRQSGFSLLELLVTLFVVVLVTSLVTLNVGSGGRAVELEATVRNLADVASYALDEAQQLGRNYGLLLQRTEVDGDPAYGYAWREWLPPEGWRSPQSGKDVFAARLLPAGVELELEFEDGPVAELPLAGTPTAAAPAPEPQVVLYASGEVMPGAIAVREVATGELLWRVEWDLLGRFQVLPRGEVETDAVD